MHKLKYELLSDDKKIVDGIALFRIRALTSFGNVKAGDIGGYIQSEENLSHIGDAWVYDNAWVFGNAKVYGDAKVYDNAWVYGDAKVYGDAEVYENAKVYDNAWVYGHACVFGDAKVYDKARVYGHAWVNDNAEVYGNASVYDNASVYGNASVSGYTWVYGNASVSGYTWVYGNAKVYKNAYIKNTTDILEVGPIGSRNDYTTFYKTKDYTIWVRCGCFNDSIEEFEKQVHETHKDTKYEKHYMNTINYVKTILK